MEERRYSVAKEVFTSLQINRWGGIVCCALLVGLSVADLLQGAGGARPQSQSDLRISSELLLIICAVLAVALVWKFFQTTAVIKRLQKVTFALDETGVSGMSFPEPMRKDAQHPNGEEFHLPYEQISAVGIVNISATKRITVPALVVQSGEKKYVLPGITELENLKRVILRRAKEMQQSLSSPDGAMHNAQ